MTIEDLINFNINKKWTNARIKFYEEQKETINKLNSILTDMPKGSRQVYDNEAESLTKLLDQINKLIEEVSCQTINLENKIKEQLELMEPTYGLILYHYYIIGDSIKYIAEKVIHHGVKYTYDLKKLAEKEFNLLNLKDVQEKKG